MPGDDAIRRPRLREVASGLPETRRIGAQPFLNDLRPGLPEDRLKDIARLYR